jgi:hypothetical protein
VENVTDPKAVALQFNVACHTEGCENFDIVIEIPSYDEVPTVICGACSQSITDVKPKPTPKKK